MTVMCCARVARAGCWVAGCRRPRRWGRSCARSLSGMSASSTGCSVETLVRAWRAGAGPGDGRLVVDVDSFIGEVLRLQEAGRRFRVHQAARVSPADRQPRGHRRGAARPAQEGTGEQQRGVLRFAEELIARVKRAGATGEKLCGPTRGSGTAS